jgi:hypothetical protein
MPGNHVLNNCLLGAAKLCVSEDVAKYLVMGQNDMQAITPYVPLMGEAGVLECASSSRMAVARRA